MTAEAGDHGGPGSSRLVLTGLLLLALAGSSYGVSFLSLGVFGVPLAIGIAVLKALTVLVVFMEFGRLPSSAKLAAGAALLMLVLLLGLMVADVGTREAAPLPPPRLTENAAQLPLLTRNAERLQLNGSGTTSR